jgi:hypothetical protein
MYPHAFGLRALISWTLATLRCSDPMIPTGLTAEGCVGAGAGFVPVPPPRRRMPPDPLPVAGAEPGAGAAAG